MLTCLQSGLRTPSVVAHRWHSQASITRSIACHAKVCLAVYSRTQVYRHQARRGMRCVLASRTQCRAGRSIRGIC